MTTRTLVERLARALDACDPQDWTIDGPLDGKLVVLRHRDDVALQIDRGHRKRRACRVFVEVEILHSGRAYGGFRQTNPVVMRTWKHFGMLPMPTRLPTDATQMRDALVAALDRAVGPAAERRLQAVRARLALDIAAHRDGTPDPHQLGWHLNLETGEIYGYRKTLTIKRDTAHTALMRMLQDVCVLRHGEIERIPNVAIPELDSAHARADALATAHAGGLIEALTLTSV
jgi:hypothetical protein